jgi:putative ABC transport system permease protein
MFYSTANSIEVSKRKANISDVIQYGMYQPDIDKLVKEWKEAGKGTIEDITNETMVNLEEKEISYNRNESSQKKQNGSITSLVLFGRIPESYNKVLNAKDKEFTLEAGEVAIPTISHTKDKIDIGDSIEVKLNGVTMNFRVKYILKDVAFGSELMGFKRFMVSNEDFDRMNQVAEDSQKRCILSINSKSGILGSELETYLAKMDMNLQGGYVFSSDMVGQSYFINMIIASVLVIVSIFLIGIAFMILRFTIVFTIQEDYKEIGIMKAIGLKSKGIRHIYTVKYLAIAVLGGLIGLCIGLPLANTLLQDLAQYLVMSDSKIRLLLAVLGVTLVVAITIWFCLASTGKIKKFTAIDAIRQGSNGERFKVSRKLILHKSKRIKVPYFLGISDILVDFRRFIILTVTFILATAIMIIPVNLKNTLQSRNMIEMLGSQRFDFYTVFDENKIDDYDQFVKDRQEEYSKIAGKVSFWGEVYVNAKITDMQGKQTRIVSGQKGISADDSKYSVLEGSVPVLKNEIGITKRVAKYFHAGVGDKLRCTVDGKEHEFIVTGIVQMMSNLGYGVRYAQDFEVEMNEKSSILWIGSFEDKSNIDEKIKDINDSFDNQTSYDYLKYLSSMMGSMLDQFDSYILMILGIVASVVFLITCLLVKMLITKEIPEIAIMKSLGFRNSTIKLWQICRIVIVLIVSIVVGTVLANTAGNSLSALIFKFLGTEQVRFVIEPLQVYLAVPLFMFVVTVIAVMSSLGRIRKTHVWEINNQE